MCQASLCSCFELDFVTFWLIRACIFLVVSFPVAEDCVFYMYAYIVHVSNVHQSGLWNLIFLVHHLPIFLIIFVVWEALKGFMFPCKPVRIWLPIHPRQSFRRGNKIPLEVLIQVILQPVTRTHLRKFHNRCRNNRLWKAVRVLGREARFEVFFW